MTVKTATRVAFQGVAGAFSEEAALAFAPDGDAVGYPTFEDAFDATVRGECDYACLPVENSLAGSINQTYDLLTDSMLMVVAERVVRVHHNLLVKPGTRLADVRRVYSHPQALAQCQNWLNAHLPNAERHAADSNAEGARIVASNPKWAAIASLRAASQFGLHVVSPSIQDDAYNRTRFAVICLPETLAMPESSGHDCTSLVVSVVNRPGAVYELLEPLKRHGVSMSRFESRPARSGQQWEYFFYIDLQGHISDPAMAAALADLRPICAYYKVLGSYAING